MPTFFVPQIFVQSAIGASGTGSTYSKNGIYVGNDGTATLNVTGSTGGRGVETGPTLGTASTVGLELGVSSKGVGTVNLSGGFILTDKVFRGAGSGTFNFNGGTLKSLAAGTTWMTGLTAANVKAGGAILDTNSYAMTIGQELLHDSGLGATVDGGLTKQNTGVLCGLSGRSPHKNGSITECGCSFNASGIESDSGNRRGDSNHVES